MLLRRPSRSFRGSPNSDERAAFYGFHFEVNVGRALAVGHRTDGAEAVSALWIGNRHSAALETGIAAPIPKFVAGVTVDTLSGALPDFHVYPAKRCAAVLRRRFCGRRPMAQRSSTKTVLLKRRGQTGEDYACMKEFKWSASTKVLCVNGLASRWTCSLASNDSSPLGG